MQQRPDPNQDLLTAQAIRPGDEASPELVLLLDLSNDPVAAGSWARLNLAPAEVRSVAKADLKSGSKLRALRQLRLMKPRVFVVFCSDLTTQSATSSIQIFGALAGARQVILADLFGRTIRRSRYSVLVAAPLALGLQLAVGYALLAPLAWLATLALEALSPIIRTGLHNHGTATGHSPIVRLSRDHISLAQVNNERPGMGPDPGPPTCRRSNVPTFQHTWPDPADLGRASESLPIEATPATPRRGLYLRATPASASLTGGMATHVSGFTDGASAIGHHLDFISSGELQGIDPASQVHIIPLSGALSATRSLFELWNSITYTIGAVRFYKQHYRDRGWEFIYQRYNRFNCAGVLLSTLTGLPLMLEYNGSEAWLARNWDPVGMIQLVKRFERINQRSADLIVVVSTAESRNLQALGVPGDRIVINPNGVDTSRFHPGCGGSELRRELGVAGKIVVGFVGSFGPWHGTEVLARAAVLMGAGSGCHFLFVGVGDLKAQTESIISQADCGPVASFVGRVPHSSIPQYLDACDILVAPHVPMPDGSAFFGSPTKLFEYLAMGRPVIASRLGQMSEILTDGENALLVEPGNPSALAEAIIRLARHEALRLKLGANARSLVLSNFTWRHNAARAFGALERFLDQRKNAGTGSSPGAGGSTRA